MLRRRPLAILLSVAAIAVGLVAGAPAADAAPTITPWSSSVAVGGTFSATANGCPITSGGGGTTYSYQSPEIRLLTGTGADRRFASFGQSVSGARVRFNVPGWVDPDQPAVLVGRCVRSTYDDEHGTETTEVLFTYPEVSMEIVAGSPAMTGPTVVLSRDVAASGQAVRVSFAGCQGADGASAILLEGDDLTLGGDITYVIGGDAEVAADGTATIDLTLLQPDYSSSDESTGVRPLAEGPYVVVPVCSRYEPSSESSFTAYGAPLALTVSGTSPSDAIHFEVGDHAISITGEQCLDGRAVTVRYRSMGIVEEGRTQREVGRAVARRDFVAAARTSAADAGGEAIVVTPDADGTWSAEVPISEDLYVIQVEVTCGDPFADGFSYGLRMFGLSGPYADVYVDRLSPTSSPTGGLVAAHLVGDCESGATVGIYRDDELLAESTATIPRWGTPAKVTFTAPSTPGTYELKATCDGTPGDRRPYEVFTPQQVAGAAPLSAEPAEGWPSQGSRDVYHGKIGPIVLPSMDMGDDEEMSSGGRAMGPTGLFVDVPKPEGDFAITKIDMNLVDADGNTVPATAAHLHHFVFGASNGKNPGCPGGSTFGIPGSIIGAAGAERTALDLGDPYGMLVDGDDQWKGVYELMSRSMESQEVYLTYDVTYRRDVENVRPVSRYFGSATGCGTFAWTVDGSGEPDVQSTYISIQKGGRLVGGGAHIHNGAAYADIVNDRGRRLCRSEITYGNRHIGHHEGHGTSRVWRSEDDEPTTTMVVGEPMPEEAYPPEFYDDDLEISSISNCGLAEAVSAGERIRFDAVYENDLARSGVMGIYSLFVWEGGGPAAPGPAPAPPTRGNPNYTG